MKLDYILLDVFTNERLSGNPLAVVTKADGLNDAQMQQIAGEFNLSETVFVFAPKAQGQAASIRIFTPTIELPFAGHPTVGVAVVLGIQNKLGVVRIEEKIGVVTAITEGLTKRGGFARFALPLLPAEIDKAPEARHIASALGLEPDDIGCGTHKPSVYSAGVVFYLVPVRNAKILARVNPERRGWPEIFQQGQNAVYIYTETPDEKENDFAARMFAPGMGLGEDPATGSAASALIGELATDAADGLTEYWIRQGLEMGRPSLISIQLRKNDGVLTHGAVGGHAVVMGEGTLDLGD